jgi:methylthioribose-1-phosphate isomerase
MPPFYSRGVTTTSRRTIWWESDDAESPAVVIDQRRLPHEWRLDRWETVDDAAAGIADMTVRGAPLIGVSAAYGMALAARHDTSLDHLRRSARLLASTRPTAVNLQWALDRCLELVEHTADGDRLGALARFAVELADEDVEQCRRIGEAGLDLIRSHAQRTGSTVNVLTHCNAGRLACIEYGTATAPVYLAVEEGIDVHVWVSETRPRNQGAALTAWELADAGIAHTLVVDNAAGHLLANGMVDLVIVGADRVAANGDTANKIGTSLKAYAAKVSDVPFYVALPWSTFDADCPDGAAIPIEERDPDEVLVVNGGPVAPEATPARNWGFDVTPVGYITGFLTPSGLIRPGGLLTASP